MSRKDTIIIALLVNAGLLALLFMLAINSEGDRVSDYPEISRALKEVQPTSLSETQHSFAIIEPNPTDEVDSFLKDLASKEAVQPVIYEDEGGGEHAAPASSAVPVAPIDECDEVHYVEVVVKRGDALEKIARSNGTTVETLKQVNHLSKTKLSIGQVLKVPVGRKDDSKGVAAVTSTFSEKREAKPIVQETVAEDQIKKVSSKTDPQYYTIKSGDNPWKIAKQYHVKFEELLELNGLDEEKARNLKIGDKIRIR